MMMTMTDRRTVASWLTSAGMEICWLAACASFALDVIGHHRYPVARAAILFAVTSLATDLTVRKHWPVGFAAGAQLTTLSAFLGLSGAPWFSYDWLSVATFLVCTVGFWIGGLLHGARVQSYVYLCTRLDIGLGWLFALVLFKLLLRAEPSVALTELVSTQMIFPFFAFALPALALARARSSVGARKTFMTGHRGTGATLGFLALSAAFTLGLVLLLVPEDALLHGAAAQSSQQGPLLTMLGYGMLLIVMIWLKLWERAPIQLGRSPSTVQGGTAPGEPALLLEPILAHEPGSWWWWVLAAVCVVAAAAIAWYAWWRNTARQRAEDGPMRPFHDLLCWLRQVWSQIRRFRTQRRQRSRQAIALQLYAGLSRWGRCSGLPRLPSETPSEYGERLKTHIESVAPEVELIVMAVNEHLYAVTPNTPLDAQRARAALRALRSPRHWAKRYEAWRLAPSVDGRGLL